MAEWTQELETFSGASVSSGEEREAAEPNSAGLEIPKRWEMETSGPEGAGLWVLLGSPSTRGERRPALQHQIPLAPGLLTGKLPFLLQRELLLLCLLLKAEAAHLPTSRAEP